MSQGYRGNSFSNAVEDGLDVWVLDGFRDFLEDLQALMGQFHPGAPEHFFEAVHPLLQFFRGNLHGDLLPNDS